MHPLDAARPDPPRLAVQVRARAARSIRQARARLARRRQRLAAAVLREGTLSIVGLGFLAGAGYTVSTTIGLLGTGAALLIIDGRIAK